MEQRLDIDAAYRRFGEAVFHRARRLSRDDALASDVLQETFLRAHKYQRSFQGGSMLSWLFTIADRVTFDALRRRGVVRTVDDAAETLARIEAGAAGDPASDAVRAESALDRMVRDEQVAIALAHVDDDTRQILVHRYVDELTTADIAVRTGQSERTIRRRLGEFFARAQRRLARQETAPAAGEG